MIIVYLAGFTRLIRGSYYVHGTLFYCHLTIAYLLYFLVTFCDDSFVTVFIQDEEDPLLYTVEKKLS